MVRSERVYRLISSASIAAIALLMVLRAVRLRIRENLTSRPDIALFSASVSRINLARSIRPGLPRSALMLLYADLSAARSRINLPRWVEVESRRGVCALVSSTDACHSAAGCSGNTSADSAELEDAASSMVRCFDPRLDLRCARLFPCPVSSGAASGGRPARIEPLRAPSVVGEGSLCGRAGVSVTPVDSDESASRTWLRADAGRRSSSA